MYTTPKKVIEHIENSKSLGLTPAQCLEFKLRKFPVDLTRYRSAMHSPNTLHIQDVCPYFLYVKYISEYSLLFIKHANNILNFLLNIFNIIKIYYKISNQFI